MKYTVSWHVQGGCDESWNCKNAKERDSLIADLKEDRKISDISYCGTTQLEYENRNN